MKKNKFVSTLPPLSLFPRCGGAEMQIQDKGNGLLIEPNNVTALKEAMQWMMEHPEERERMQNRASLGVIGIEEHVKELRNDW